MEMAAEEPRPDRNLTLPDGTVLSGYDPVVIIGPNGSGKTRKARDIQASYSIEFVNALRNTRIPVHLPAMAFTEAENQFISLKNQSRGTHWDWTNEFDSPAVLVDGSARDCSDQIYGCYKCRSGTSRRPELPATNPKPLEPYIS
jgi:hypothetical protein